MVCVRFLGFHSSRCASGSGRFAKRSRPTGPLKRRLGRIAFRGSTDLPAKEGCTDSSLNSDRTQLRFPSGLLAELARIRHPGRVVNSRDSGVRSRMKRSSRRTCAEELPVVEEGR